ncbi:MAG TPA: lipopolysaccharide heptosyltransferase II [Burkholderiales bacterium]|nr:lipopolysaccharide heptosyltransferase II [Burkholderiales bacterium]
MPHHKILVVAPSWVGDAVLAQPMFRGLHQRFQGLALDVLAPPWVAALYERMVEVDQIILSPFRHGELNLAQRWKLGRSLANKGYEQAIVLPNSWKSALIPFFAGISLRTGFTGEMRFGLLNDARPLDKKQFALIVERFALLAEQRGVRPQTPLSHPSLRVSAGEREHTLKNMGLNVQKSVAVFCPGAEYGPAKRWPAKYFAELAQRLENYQIWLIGSPNDQHVGEEIRQLSGGIAVNLCGKTSLAQAIELLSCATLVVSNDSGLMHIAAALDKPMLALFGSSSPAFTPPLSNYAQVLKLDLPCSPCFQRICPLGHFNCMMQLTPDKVLAKIGVQKP